MKGTWKLLERLKGSIYEIGVNFCFQQKQSFVAKLMMQRV